MEDVKVSSHSRKLRNNVSRKEGEGQAKRSFARGIMKEKDSSNDKCQFRSKSRLKKRKCHYCHKSWNFR